MLIRNISWSFWVIKAWKKFEHRNFSQTSLGTKFEALFRCLNKIFQLFGIWLISWRNFPKDKYLRELLIIHLKRSPGSLKFDRTLFQNIWTALCDVFREIGSQIGTAAFDLSEVCQSSEFQSKLRVVTDDVNTPYQCRRNLFEKSRKNTALAEE